MIELHPPDAPVAHLLPHISQRHFRRVQELLADLGLYRGQPRLLAVLWEREGWAHSELAEQLGVAPATITKMAQRMEQAGFVSRTPDAEDQRISRVYLTEKGRLVRGQVDEVFRTLEEDMLIGFDDAERSQLLAYLQRISANLGRGCAASTGAVGENVVEGTAVDANRTPEPETIREVAH